jgi:hypothetical protein
VLTLHLRTCPIKSDVRALIRELKQSALFDTESVSSWSDLFEALDMQKDRIKGARFLSYLWFQILDKNEQFKGKIQKLFNHLGPDMDFDREEGLWTEFVKDMAKRELREELDDRLVNFAAQCATQVQQKMRAMLLAQTPLHAQIDQANQGTLAAGERLSSLLEQGEALLQRVKNTPKVHS